MFNLDHSSCDKATTNRVPMYLWCKDTKGNYIYCNERMLKDVGLEKETDIQGLTDFDLYWKKFAPLFKKNDDAIFYHEKPQVFIEESKNILNQTQIFYSNKMLYLGNSKKKLGTMGTAFLWNKISINHEYLVTKNNIVKQYLSQRQFDCLLYVAKGYSANEIAALLNLSKRTIEHYIVIIKEKLNCYSRAELIQKAFTFDDIKENLF